MALTLDYIQPTDGSFTIPVRDLTTRVIQFYQAPYINGEWNPNTTYNWVPGAYADFTPRRADSRIRYTMRIPTAWVAASHAISHWYFYANGTLYWYWSESGTHIENGKTFQFDVPSWGTTSGRIGIQHRCYAEDNHEVRLYTTYYWDGGGRNAQIAKGQLIIEEISV